MDGLDSGAKTQASPADLPQDKNARVGSDWDVFAREHIVMEAIDALPNGTGALVQDFNAGRSHPTLRTGTLRGHPDRIMVMDVVVTYWRRIHIAVTDHFGVLATIGASAANTGQHGRWG